MAVMNCSYNFVVSRQSVNKSNPSSKSFACSFTPLLLSLCVYSSSSFSSSSSSSSTSSKAFRFQVYEASVSPCNTSAWCLNNALFLPLVPLVLVTSSFTRNRCAMIWSIFTIVLSFNFFVVVVVVSFFLPLPPPRLDFNAR